MSSGWRSQCPESVEKSISLAEAQVHAEITAQADPSVFSVVRKGERFVVRLGPQHACTCRRAQPCVHVILVLRRWFSVARTNPVLWQRGMKELEIVELLSTRDSRGRRQCALCREEMPGRGGCAFCGEPFHQRCAELKAKSQGASEPCCPKCHRRSAGRAAREGWPCEGCQATCGREHYCCPFCPDVHVCSKCFLVKSVHAWHPLQKVDNEVVENSPASRQDALELQNRELAPEDYHLLLSLDPAGGDTVKLTAEEFGGLTRSVVTREESSQWTCAICLDELREGATAVVFPCGHRFHEGCGKRWATQCSAKCPIDQLPCVP